MVLDWWAVGTGRRRAEIVLKPLTMSALVVLALVAGSAEPWTRGLVVVGAVFGLLGDIALLNAGQRWFLRGLVAFAVGHLLYGAAAVSSGLSTTAWWGLLFVVVLFAWRFIPRVVPGARAAGGAAMMWAVVAYAFIIAIMVVSAFGTNRWAAAIGAALFAGSDWVLGQRTFVGPDEFPRLAVMVPYHVGQTLLIVGLLQAS